jgi:lipopolysaccharide export system protein LptA
MKSQRGLLFTLIACVIISSFIFMSDKPLWLTASKVIPSKTEVINKQPEYQIIGFNSKQFGETGELSSTSKAKSFTFFKEEKLSELEKPIIKVFSRGNNENSLSSNWQIKANLASSIAPNKFISFKDNVEMLQLDTESQLQVFSQEMDLNIDEKIAKSSKKVTIISGDNKIYGNDFESHLENANFELRRNVESEYQETKVKDPKETSLNSYQQPRILTIKSEKFFLENKKNKATYTENVVLKQDDVKIIADKIEILKFGDSQIAYAFGNPAYFEQQSSLDNKHVKAQANRFEFDSREQKLKMYDNAVLQQGDAIVEGDYLYYDTQTENIGAESKPDTRIKMTIPSPSNNKKTEPLK